MLVRCRWHFVSRHRHRTHVHATMVTNVHDVMRTHVHRRMRIMTATFRMRTRRDTLRHPEVEDACAEREADDSTEKHLSPYSTHARRERPAVCQ